MNSSSGIKRGLATIAVSALAVSGLAGFAGTAHAAPLRDQAGGADQVVLYSQFAASKKISAEADGNNSSISLVAGAGADIVEVKFQYSNNGTDWIDITTVAARGANGDFSAEWTPGAGLAGATVSLRAVGSKTAGGATADTDVRAGLTLVGAQGGDSVHVDGTEFRVFQQPYGGENNKHLGAVSGSTSAAKDSEVTVSARSGGANGTATAKVSATNTFKAVLDIAGYGYGSFTPAGNTNNQIVIGAELSTDDAAAFNIVRQEITTVNVLTAGPSAPLGGTTTVEVEVLDQDGEPVIGAQVYDTNGSRLIGYTDVDGKVKDTAAAAGSHTYYANSTADVARNAGVDKSDDVVVAGYQQTPTTIAASSKDGLVFADNEYTDGDIVVTVTDQNGNPVANRKVEYKWAVPTTPASNVPATGWAEAVTDATGKAVVVFPVSAPSGAATLTYRVPADSNGQGAVAEKNDLTVTAGKAVAALTPAAGNATTTAAGGSITYTATVTLDDAANTVLKDREVVFTYARGTEKAPADGVADAGIVPAVATDPVVLTRTIKTDATGVATVDVKDAAVTDATKVGSELGGKLTAVVLGVTKEAKADFNSSLSLGEVKLTQVSAGLSQPGAATKYTVTVKNDDTSPRANAEVAVSLDKGFIVKTDALGAPVLDKDAQGNPIPGDYAAADNQTMVKTDVNGEATILWAIERDADFDDDGALVANLTASFGGVEQKDTESWYSGNNTGSQLDPQTGNLVANTTPAKIGSVDLSLAEKQESTVLPKANLDQTVNLDLVVTDQFGNRVKASGVTIVDNTSKAYTSGSTSQFTADASTVRAYADDATNQRIFASLGGVNDASPVDIEWYQVDLSQASIELTKDTADTVAVNTAVTEKVTVLDQEGQGIDDVTVEFLRSGPAPQDGDVNYATDTNRNGVATYNFVGTQAGVANITAVVRAGVTQLAKLTDKVTFEAPVAPVADVTAKLGGKNNGKKADKLKVSTTPAASGAVVKLQALNAKGKWKTVATATTKANGKVTIKAADANGKAKTSYRVKVAKTATTKAATSNTKSVK